MKKKFLSVILFDKLSQVGYKRTIRDINFLIKSLNKNDKLTIIDLRKYYFGKKIIKGFNYKNRKIKYFKPKNIIDFWRFTKNKIIYGYGPINPEIRTILIFILIKFFKIRLFFFNSYGFYLNENPLDQPDIKLKVFYFFKSKLLYYFYRILSVLKILPTIFCYFETSEKRIQQINNTKIYKLKQNFKYLDFTYFKKVKRINCIYHDEIISRKFKKTNKSIVLIDSGPGHPDSEKRYSNFKRLNDKKINFFYFKVIKKLKQFSKNNKYKIYFCKHPKTYYPKNCFKNIKNIKNIDFNFKADKHIFSAKYIFFTGGSSMINKAIYLKKKFFVLKSEQTDKNALRLLDSVNSIFKLNYIDIDNKKIKRNATNTNLFSEKKYKRFIADNLVFKKNVHSSIIIKDTLFKDYAEE
jgi:hypothetical protein